MSIVEKAIGKLRSDARNNTGPVDQRRRADAPPPREPRGEGRPEPRAELRPEPPHFERPIHIAASDDCVADTAPLRIDLDALRAAGGLPPQNAERQIADEYRRIKWPVLERAFGRADVALPERNFVMVTSALPGDGKTFTSLNLALSIARERDSSVLLIDADIARARMSELLGIRQRPGLTELLEHPGTDPARHILATDIEGLRVMPAGRVSDQVPELMASQRMRDLFAELGARNRERVIIFDSSPLLATNESQVLAKLVGQVLMVVRANGTPRPAVEEAVSLLDRSRSISLVLNQMRTVFGLGSYYSGYYNYNYGTGQGES